mgnify:CR=1 FL=1
MARELARERDSFSQRVAKASPAPRPSRLVGDSRFEARVCSTYSLSVSEKGLLIQTGRDQAKGPSTWFLSLRKSSAVMPAPRGAECGPRPCGTAT